MVLYCKRIELAHLLHLLLYLLARCAPPLNCEIAQIRLPTSFL